MRGTRGFLGRENFQRQRKLSLSEGKIEYFRDQETECDP